MMNGILMTGGVDAVSIPAVRAAEFNSRMVDFYASRDATEMMAFVLDCHPEVSQIRQLNPGVYAVRDLPEIKYFSLSDSIKQEHHDVPSSRGAAEDPKATPVREQPTRALTLEETRLEARENWRRNYYEKRANQLAPQADSSYGKEPAGKEKTRTARDTGLDFDPER